MRLAKPLFAAALAFSLNTSGMAEVVAVVSAKSPMTTLTRNQVTDIFLGKTSRFPNGEQVTPIDQMEGSPARDEFYAAFAGKTAAQVKAHWSKIIFTGRGQPPREAANSDAVISLIAENPTAIGYVDRGKVAGGIKILAVQ